MKIFISYSRVDKETVLKIVEALSDYDITFWMDVRNIPHGSNWDMEVQRGLDGSDLMLIMLSPDSVASQNVADEWNYFLTKDKPVIPVVIRPCDIPFRLARRQYVDVSKDLSASFPQLIRALGSPKLKDPDATAKLKTVKSNGQTTPIGTPTVEPKPDRIVPRAPASEPAVAFQVRSFPVGWANRYHWLTGLSDGFTEGELLINERELLFVPLDRPVISVPFKNIIRASEANGIGGIDPHIDIEYYGTDGRALRMVMMGAVPKNRSAVNRAVLEVSTNTRRVG